MFIKLWCFIAVHKPYMPYIYIYSLEYSICNWCIMSWLVVSLIPNIGNSWRIIIPFLWLKVQYHIWTINQLFSNYWYQSKMKKHMKHTSILRGHMITIKRKTIYLHWRSTSSTVLKHPGHPFLNQPVSQSHWKPLYGCGSGKSSLRHSTPNPIFLWSWWGITVYVYTIKICLGLRKLW